MRLITFASLVLSLLAWLPSFAVAQDVTVVNAASYVNPSLPNGSIAQGSMFIGFGAGMGPASIQYPSPWPFPADLAGTSIEVTVGATTVQCFMVYTSAGQVAAILPSNTPVGAGTVTVKYNGSIAATGGINVVKHSFGIFTVNTQGFGPIVGTDPLANAAVYSVTNAAAPGDFIDIWGTGLGPVAFPDEGQPTPGTLGYDVHVFLGDVEVPVEYAGRNCCSAIDTVRVKAPVGLSGCFVPVAVVVGGITSNYGTIALDPSGNACTADQIFGGPNFSQLQNGGTLDIGSLYLSRQRISFDIDIVGPQVSFDQTTDTAGGSYVRVSLANLQEVMTYTPSGINQFGACTVFRFTGENPQGPQTVVPTPLDAGAQLSINSQAGADVIPKTAPGSYFKSFSTILPPFLSPEGQDQIPSSPPYFEPGLATIMAPGGANIGSHSASIVIPQDFEWLNQPQANDVINRGSGYQVNYNASGFDYVNIFGYSATMANGSQVGAGFFCAADASAGSFTIPAAVLQSLPMSQQIQGIPLGGLTVGGYVTDSFNAADLDVRTIVYSDATVVSEAYN